MPIAHYLQFSCQGASYNVHTCPFETMARSFIDMIIWVKQSPKPQSPEHKKKKSENRFGNKTKRKSVHENEESAWRSLRLVRVLSSFPRLLPPSTSALPLQPKRRIAKRKRKRKTLSDCDKAKRRTRNARLKKPDLIIIKKKTDSKER